MPDLVETPDNEPAMQAAQILNRHSDKTPVKNKDSKEATTPEVNYIFHHRIIFITCCLLQFGMSVLMCRDEENKETPKCPLLSNQIDSVSPRSKHTRNRESSRHVNQTAEKEEVLILYCAFSIV